MPSVVGQAVVTIAEKLGKRHMAPADLRKAVDDGLKGLNPSQVRPIWMWASFGHRSALRCCVPASVLRSKHENNHLGHDCDAGPVASSSKRMLLGRLEFVIRSAI